MKVKSLGQIFLKVSLHKLTKSKNTIARAAFHRPLHSLNLKFLRNFILTNWWFLSFVGLDKPYRLHFWSWPFFSVLKTHWRWFKTCHACCARAISHSRITFYRNHYFRCKSLKSHELFRSVLFVFRYPKNCPFWKFLRGEISCFLSGT